MKKEFHAFYVHTRDLRKFLEYAQADDSMRGNTVEKVEKYDHRYLVLISREYSYPFIINRLREIEGSSC